VAANGSSFIDRPIDLAVLLVALAAASVAVFSLRDLRFDPDMSVNVAGNAEKAEYEVANRLFPDEHLVFVSMPCGDPFAESSLRRLRDLSSALEERAEEGSWKLYGPTTVEDFFFEGGELVPEILLDPSLDPGSGGERLRARLGDSPLLSRLFLSSDGRAWTLLLSPEASSGAFLDEIRAIKESFPEVKVAGQRYYDALGERMLVREFGPIIAAATMIMLIVELIVLRSALPALLLWACSSLPALLLMGLFAITGTPMRLHYVLAPALTLSLSNSYVTHVYRGWAESGFDPRAALKSKARASLLDALTTVLGFGSLFLSPVRELVMLGVFSIAGAVFSLFSGLIVLPAALGLARRPSVAALRFAALKTGKVAAPRFPALRVAVWAAACVALVVFSQRVGTGAEIGKVFMPWSDEARETAYFEESYVGLNEISLVLATGKENGLVDPGLFRSLEELQRDIAAMRGISAVYGPTDLVGEVLARWEGAKAGSVEPESESDIGESLQLLSGAAGGLFARGFVDPAWSAAKIRIAVSQDFSATKDFPGIKKSVGEAIARDAPGLVALWSGDIVRTSIDQRCFIKGQTDGALGFFLALFAGLCLVFRSIARAFLMTLVPATGFLASLGAMGVMGWSISPVHAVALATIAGTGVDSAIVMALSGWSKEARSGTVDSTLLITLSMTSLLFCSSFPVVQTTAICIAGLLASMLSAIFILPAFGVMMPEKRSSIISEQVNNK
jgi:uncharacterized protein